MSRRFKLTATLTVCGSVVLFSTFRLSLAVMNRLSRFAPTAPMPGYPRQSIYNFFRAKGAWVTDARESVSGIQTDSLLNE
jgi:hypothetical protein